MQPCTVALCFQLAPDDLSEALASLRLRLRRIVCLPINDGAELLEAPRSVDSARGTHWSLLAFDRGGGEGSSDGSGALIPPCFIHFDSMPGSRNENVARLVAEEVWPLICCSGLPIPFPRIERGICSEQDNEYDCGIHTLLSVRQIAGTCAVVAQDLREFTSPATALAERKRLLAKVRAEAARGAAR